VTVVVIYRDDRQEFGVLFVGSVRSVLQNSIQKYLGTKPESTVGFAENVEAAKA
jgi:hypothetical protein